MFKKTIEYVNQKQFENSVRPIWECIENIFPGKPWFGHSTAGNVSNCENNNWVKAIEFYSTINSESPTVFCEEFDCLHITYIKNI